MNEKTMVFKYNVDPSGNPISVKIKEIAQVSPLKHMIQLEQLPDELYGVTLLNKDNSRMKQVYKYEEVDKNPNSYYVNYANGLIYFNSTQGAEKKVINYYGTGMELISAKRIFDEYYKADGTFVQQTLQELIDEGREAIELLGQFGGASSVIQTLNQLVTEGNLVIQDLKDEIQGAINVSGNEVVIINADDWAYNPTSKMYEHTINHTMNSKDLIIDCYNLATGDFVLCGGKIVNNNSVLIKSETNIDLKVVLNARYYKATLTISDDIVREVVEARIDKYGCNHSNIGDRIYNIEDRIDVLEPNDNGDIAGVTSRLDNVETNLNTLDTDFTAFKDNLETSIDNLETSIDNLETSIDKIETSIDKINVKPTLSDKFIHIAHRGFSGVAPENTIVSYETAFKNGLKYVECDLQLTSDKKFVLFHDSSVDRITNGTGSISSKTYNQVKSLKVDGGNNVKMYPPMKVASLEEFLTCVSRLSLIPIIELSPLHGFEETELKYLIKCLTEYNLIDKCFIISFTETTLKRVRNINNEVKLMFIADITDENIEKCLQLGSCDIDCDYSTVTNANVLKAHTNGLRVNCYTVNNYTDYMRLKEMGVDMITSDYIYE